MPANWIINRDDYRQHRQRDDDQLEDYRQGIDDQRAAQQDGRRLLGQHQNCAEQSNHGNQSSDAHPVRDVPVMLQNQVARQRDERRHQQHDFRSECAKDSQVVHCITPGNSSTLALIMSSMMDG